MGTTSAAHPGHLDHGLPQDHICFARNRLAVILEELPVNFIIDIEGSSSAAARSLAY